MPWIRVQSVFSGLVRGCGGSGNGVLGPLQLGGAEGGTCGSGPSCRARVNTHGAWEVWRLPGVRVWKHVCGYGS